MSQVDEVTEGIYRISTFEHESGPNFNRFLIEDDHPALIHTGMYPSTTAFAWPWARSWSPLAGHTPEDVAQSPIP